ncbi:RluA family pseudouridine synthase [Salibacterium halotolerans]|uniref:Pseudouridine synthase n=1 Tax=Salibacterium halotolerans TaxID=1884432 RepID=A0A1I5TCS8_9BACI|nr:RluA family pseudouridine synthase [Salibacterium halotolerans]SFP80226.1 23S rRNA pseudouridine1911/1915/1917 synthase [Salibacterium halotolerans]
MNGFHELEWVIPREAEGKSVKTYLRQHKKMSGSTWKVVKKDGEITVNNKPASGNDGVRYNDVLCVYLPEMPFPEGIPVFCLPLDILFEDRHLLVVNKPPHLPTLPGRGRETETLAGAVRYYYEQSGIRASFHAVSRLDRETSGIVTIAKHRYAHQRLASFFDTYSGLKQYIGITRGNWYPSEGIIHAPIERKPESIVKHHVTTHGKRAKTGFQVVKRSNERSLVRFTLHSGRTHQIRVHSAYAGHPILGDDLYGAAGVYPGRHALHAFRLCFIHPVTEKWQTIEARMPVDMQGLM